MYNVVASYNRTYCIVTNETCNVNEVGNSLTYSETFYTRIE